MHNYRYKEYISVNQETRWASADEIKSVSTHIHLSDPTYPAAGLPLISDGRDAYVDATDTHTLIFGATGSKKTRLFCMPMIGMFIKAGESFVVTDPKGELYNRSSGMAEANGFHVSVLNLRDIGRGDMWNPLAMPYVLYHSGKTEQAVSQLNDFINVISAPSFARTNDVFWAQMASSYALANLLLIMECATPQEANVSSLSALCSNESIETLKKLSKLMDEHTIAGMNFRNVLTSPEKTLQSILASLYAMLTVFNTQKELCRVLSGNTIDMTQIGRRKTALYIIVPDEKTTVHFLATTFLKQVYEVMIAEAQKEPDGMLPIRVNFVLDEFCNIPKLPDMPSMISAARSRNIRYFLVVQSLHQLKGRYEEDADTIKGNCENRVFLTSKELDLLNETSELCGEITTSQNGRRRLISVSELQRLNKDKGEALIMHARQYPIISEMADIDQYEAFKGYAPLPLPDSSSYRNEIFSLTNLLERIIKGKCDVPFSSNQDSPIMNRRRL